MQFRQLEHSSDQTDFTLSTFIFEEQAFAQRLQSIQLIVFRLIFVGLRSEAIPNNAP